MKLSLPDKCKSIQALVLVVSSMFLIWLPTFDVFFHLDKTPPLSENRASAKFPTLQSGLDSLHKYVSGIEGYFNDHFGFRNRLIRWQHKWKHELFRDIPLANDAVVGRNGWLFYSGDHTVENIQGINTFSTERLQTWKKFLEDRRDWCAKRGIAYIFVVPPEKHSIYPEYMPDWLLPIKEPTKLDQFMSYMKANSTVPILDLRPALLQAKAENTVYFHTDLHWNYFGAFVGYQTLIKKLSEQLPNLKPLQLNNFELKNVPEPGQDLARNLGLAESTTEPANIIFSPLPPLKPLAVNVSTNITLKTRINRIEPRFTENPDATGKAIVFHDSFANYWTPFLGYHFNKVIYTWQPNWDTDFLEREKPTVIIDEILERHVVNENPAQTLSW